MYAYFGTTASETLNASNWNYNWNAFYMGDGNDTVITPVTGVGYQFHGGNGNNDFVGDSARDIAIGGNNNDTLKGYGDGDSLDGNEGRDTLQGHSGTDSLSGGGGVDHLHGGTGRDDLFGGYNDGSADCFHFAKGDSNATSSGADTIYDWDVRYDYIDSSIAGRSNGYSESATSATSIASARSIVEHNSSLSDGDHTFLYNSRTDTGYLLSDLDGNYTFETGVIIKGAGSASDMSWSDILRHLPAR